LIDGGFAPFFIGYIMNNFLIEIVYEPVYNAYMACYSSGQNIILDATTYQDAVMEADLIDLEEYA
jgi:hypothetical protein